MCISLATAMGVQSVSVSVIVSGDGCAKSVSVIVSVSGDGCAESVSVIVSGSN